LFVVSTALWRSAKVHGIQLFDRVFHERCDDVRGLGIRDRILAVCVQQNLIQALLHLHARSSASHAAH
jgi:hypothetical protein